MDVKQYLSEWSECYRKDFVENIMPFWMKNGLDRKHGGVYTCLDRDGTLMDTTKSVWFQGRFGFIASYAYNNIEKFRNGSLHRRAVSTSSKRIALIPTDTCSSK